jgi:DNA-binding response OmpR family regulator
MARVLLAESDQRIGDFIAGILTEFGHQVTMCASAVEASARLTAEPVDVLLTDLMLYGDRDAQSEQAWEALDIPTITLTGRVFSVDPSAPTPPALIDKPFRFADLRSVLDAVAACTEGGEGSRARIRTAA